MALTIVMLVMTDDFL